MKEEPLNCRGINGSISLSKDGLTIIGIGRGSAQPREIRFGDVSSIVVQRKSVVPFATSMILAIIVFLIARYNLLWFLIDLSRWEPIITSVALVITAICAVAALLRFTFVNVIVRSRRQPIVLRLVPGRCAKRLVRRFREIYAGG